MSFRSQQQWWRWPALAAALLAVTGCAETPTAPSLSPSLDVAESGSAPEEGLFVSNAQKYSDRGAHPAIGRSGSATAAAQALLARDGRVTVEIVAGEWDGWTRNRRMHDDPQGDARLAMVQLKAFDPDGGLQFTRAITGLDARSTVVLANGVLRGGRAQVQANVRGADPTRTGIVTVDAPVRLRPDLAVAELRRPPRAVRNTAVPIVAVVRELNGEVGAWADCVLYVNGIESDRAYGIWVEPGGTVTCVMMHMFRAVGASQVEVRVEEVAPGDYDPANNAAAGVMNVIFVPSAFYFDAAFTDRSFASTSEYESSWSYEGGRFGGESNMSDESSGRVQQSFLSGYMPRAIAFPIGELFARQYTRDETAHQVLFRQLPADWSYEDSYLRQSCAARGFDQPATGRGWLYVCSHELLEPEGGISGFTTVQYDRYAGDVTYASRGHSRYWDRDLGLEDVYSWNNSGRDLVGRFVSYGLEYAFFIRIIDRGQVYTTNPFIGLLPFETSQQMPRTCWSWEDSWGSSRSCSAFSTTETGVTGWVFGDPSP